MDDLSLVYPFVYLPGQHASSSSDTMFCTHTMFYRCVSIFSGFHWNKSPLFGRVCHDGQRGLKSMGRGFEQVTACFTRLTDFVSIGVACKNGAMLGWPTTLFCRGRFYSAVTLAACEQGVIV